MSEKSHNSEWTYNVRADSVPNNGRHVKIKANPQDCIAIGERIGVLSVDNVDAMLVLTPQNAGHVMYVQGHFIADIKQNCVISGKVLPSHIEEDFEAWFADYDKAVPFNRAKREAKMHADGEEIQMLEEHEDPEPMIDGQVDLADLVVQHLSLAVNPYPRDTAFITEEDEVKVADINLRPNPFAALKNWRPKD